MMFRCSFISEKYRGNIKTFFGFLSLVFLLFVLPGTVGAQFVDVLTIEKVKPRNPVVDAKPGKKFEFEVKAESTNGRVYPIDRIVFSATEDPEVDGREVDPCTFFCGADDHKVKYKWGENVWEATVTATVYSKNQLASPATVSWTVRVGGNQQRPPEPEEPPELLKTRITPAERNSYWVKPGLNPLNWFQVVGNHHLDVGKDMTFQVKATSKDGIFSIKFEADEQRPSTEYQFESPKTTRFPKAPSHTVNYTWHTSGKKEVTATVETSAGAVKRIKWTIEVQDPKPMNPDLRVSVSRVDPDTLTVSVLTVSGNSVEEDHIVPLAPGDKFQLRATVQNSGSKASRQTNLRFYHSLDRNISRSDTLLRGMGSRVEALEAGDAITITSSQDFTAPTEPGDHYYGACVEGVPGESDTSNNCSTGVKITVRSPTVEPPRSPDLIVGSLSVSKTSLDPGEDFTLSTRVQNIGTGDAGPTSLRYYGYGPEVNRKRATIPRLAANAVSPEKSITLKAPNAEDSYVYEVCIGSVRNESNTNNNCATVTINVGTVPIQDREPEPIQNSGPESVGQISNQTLRSGGSALRLDLSNYFRDADGDNLRYTMTSDNPNVAFLQVVGTSMNILPLSAGSTNVTVTASDGSLTTTQRFSVTVTTAPVDNRAPVSVGTVPTQSLTDPDGTTLQVLVFSVSGYFSDSDGDSLTYTARSDDTNVVTASVSGTYLTLTPQRAGSATITVTASDGSATATQRFTVTVQSTVQSASFRVGDAIIVQDSSGGGLNGLLVRNGAGTGFVHIISAFDGATGVIRDGPEFANGYTWWFVRWDRSNKVLCDVNPCEGWVFESFRGTDVITEHIAPGVEVQPNQGPAKVGTITTQRLTVDGSSVILDVSGNFQDPDNDGLSYTARSDNTGVATASTSGSQITLTPQRAGSATVTVTASDGSLTAEQNFAVTVAARQQVRVNEPNLGGNTRPRVDRLINPQNFRVGASSKWFNLSSYFSDPDNDKLTYTAASNNDRVVTVRIVGNSIEITPSEHNSGTAEITVTARDSSGLTESFDFRVTIAEAITIIPDLPVCDRTPQIRDEIVSIARVRNCDQVTDDHLDKIRRLSVGRAGITSLQVGDFDGLRNLTRLHLGENRLTTLPVDGFFHYLRQLTSLSLNDNQLMTLLPDTFEDLRSLESLNLQNNQLAILREGVFERLETLNELELNNNLITTIEPDVFRDLSSLVELNLQDNRLSILATDVFLGLNSLEYLTLDGNPLQTIQTGAFRGLSNLTDLDFRGSSLQVIQTGAFQGMSLLEELDLSESQLSSLSSGVFDGLSALDRLYLEGTPLTTLPRDVFSGLSNLRELFLEASALRTIQVGAFNGLRSLTELDLSGSQLSALSLGVFGGLSALDELNLQGNSLTSLPTGVFDGLSALEDLDLSENSLNSLPIGIFDGLDALKFLDLDGNQLTTLPKGIFDDILDTLGPSASYVDFDSLKTTFGFSATTQDAAEGDTVRVEVNLGRSLPVAIRVPYTVGGTATADDYTNLQTPTELLFLAGETSKEIIFTLLEDADSTAETISLTLSELSDVKLRKSDGSGSDAKLSAYALLNEPQQTVHTVTVTTSGEGVLRPMYWTAGDNKIRRSKLDGTQVQVLFEGGNLRDIALDVSGGKMYWVDTGIDAIRRANLDGSGVVNLVANLGSPTGLALDVSGGKIYWLDYHFDKIQRANLNGSGVEDLVTGLDRPQRIALDVSGGKMYWTDTGTDKIQRANLNGSGVEDLVTGLSSPRGIALDVSGGKMYWIDSSTDKIQRANLNGTNVEDLVTGISIGADGLALDVSGGKMYWADNQEDKICRANLDGSQIERLYSGNYPIGIALAIGPGGATHAAPSAVHTNLAPGFPAETALLPNYPNPFNPETWLPYQLSEASDVTVRIYSVNGSLVRTLDLGHQSAGVYRSRSRAAYWDGRNAFGERVASGVYFYTLRAGNFTATRKMLIRK